jgi:hypothetical protein
MDARRTILPGESFFQAVLANAGRFRLANDDRRYDFGATKDGHSRTLSAADLPLLAGRGYHFARKLDLERHPELFDLLDDQVFPTE